MWPSYYRNRDEATTPNFRQEAHFVLPSLAGMV